jgi:hypothetical protein
MVIDTAITKKKKNKRERADDLCGRALEMALTAAYTASSVVVHYRGGGETGRRWTLDMDKRELYALFALPFATETTAELPDMENIRSAAGSATGRKNTFIVIKDTRDMHDTSNAGNAKNAKEAKNVKNNG